MTKKTIYTIEVTTCSNPKLYWYHDHIGQKFECFLQDNHGAFFTGLQIYKTTKPIKLKGFNSFDAKHMFFVKDDCKVLAETKQQ